MRKRVAYGLLLSSVILGLLYLDHYLSMAHCFSALVLCLSLLGWREFSEMALPGRKAWHLAGAAAVAAFCVTIWFWVDAAGTSLALLRSILVPAMIFIFLFWAAITWNGSRPTFAEGAVLVVGIFYLGFLPTYLLQVRYLPHGEGIVILFILAVKLGDSGAYFAGRTLGRIRFSRVSPQKTVEGSVAGLLTTCAAATVGSRFLLPEGFCAIHEVLIAAAVVAFLGQTGDLIESLLKRSCGTKHSASVVPEMGGALDMIDSVVFGAPALFFLVTWHTGI